MAAEIVAIVENEDARLFADGAAIKIGGGEPADAASDHDEIVARFGTGLVDAETLALTRKRMRRFERARMLAAQAGERGGITRSRKLFCGKLRRGRQARSRSQARCR